MSSGTAAQPRNYRFDQFELFPTQGSLLKDGSRVPLNPKPLATLVLLVERAGETVPKEELLERVWEGSTVEENNLTQSISTLRKVLGEKRGENRYIFTDPGKGYRFVASVSAIGPALTAISADVISPEPDKKAGRPQRARFMVVATVCLALCVGLGVWLRYRSGGTRPSRHSVAVLRIRDLSKASSEAWMQTALSELLTSELAAGDKLETIPAEDVVRWQNDLGNTSEGVDQSRLLRSARQTFGADAFVLGSYIVIGTCPDCRVRVDLGLYNARTGSRSGTIIDEGPARDLLDLTARLGTKLRADLGVNGTPEAVPRFPASEAMREYAEGLTALRLMDPMAARDHLQAAVAADGSNALIHAALADAWTALGYNARAGEEYQRAYDLSKSLGRLDQLGIEARYRATLQQWDRAIEIYSSVWKLFPDSLEDGLNLARAQTRGHQYANASATLQKLRGLAGPAGKDPRIDLLEAQNAGGVANFSRTREYAHRAAAEAASREARYLYARSRLLEGGAMATLGDQNWSAVLTEARTRCEEIGDRSCVSQAWRIRGNTQFAYADFPSAQEAYMNGLAIARELGDRAEMAKIVTGLAVVARSRRDWQQAEQMLREAISLQIETGYSPSDVQTNLVELYIEIGRSSDALQLLENAEAAARETGEQQDLGEVFRLRAAIALSAGRLDEAQRLAESAVATLRPTNGYEPLTLALAQLSSILTVRGDLKRAGSLLAEASPGSVPELAGSVALARAELLLAGGQFEEANTAAKSATAAFGKANLDVESAQALMVQADALEMLGRREEALAASLEAERSAARTPNKLPAAFARLAEWRFAPDSSAVLPPDLKATIASLRNPELDLAEKYARAMRARNAQTAASLPLFHDLADTAAKRGYVTLSRRALSLGNAP
jgi:DNA-binding winged helix-turn-helix (wHTH) protein/tetratricopeptide (TPR) repeat protein